MNTTTPNALLAAADLPLFDAITPEQVGPAVDQLLADANAALEQVTAPDFPAATSFRPTWNPWVPGPGRW